MECVIKYMKDQHLFDRMLPLTLSGSVNQLWTVWYFLDNFQSPLLQGITRKTSLNQT